ncbi:MAG TPA: hypothetical protein VKS22_07480 [Candidatus Binataceae bacterium]|nr:hypothetical protein [Candidatus Binataceae bacterium]
MNFAAGPLRQDDRQPPILEARGYRLRLNQMLEFDDALGGAGRHDTPHHEPALARLDIDLIAIGRKLRHANFVAVSVLDNLGSRRMAESGGCLNAVIDAGTRTSPASDQKVVEEIVEVALEGVEYVEHI